MTFSHLYNLPARSASPHLWAPGSPADTEGSPSPVPALPRQRGIPAPEQAVDPCLNFFLFNILWLISVHRHVFINRRFVHLFTHLYIEYLLSTFYMTGIWPHSGRTTVHKMPLYLQDLSRPGILFICFSAQGGTWPWVVVQCVPLITNESGQGHPHGAMDPGQITPYESAFLPPSLLPKGNIWFKWTTRKLWERNRRKCPRRATCSLRCR